MDYREYLITPELQPFVRLIWSMDDLAINDLPMRILPDGCVEVVFHYRDNYMSTFSDGVSEKQPNSFVVTQMRSFLDIKPTGTTGFMAIRFSASGACQFFGIPMKEIAGYSTDLSNAWGSPAKEIEDRILSASSNIQRVSIIQDYLLLQITKHYRESKTVNYCLNEIALSAGQVSIDALARKAGIGNRQLLRQFDAHVGLSPKEFARIVKFNHALRYMQRNPATSMTDAAHYSGYYDQAHFIRDIKEYSGMTPTEYMQRDNVFF